MIEITKTGRFITKFYGGQAYLPGDERVKLWLESQQDRLLHPRCRELKAAVGNEKKLEEILSCFNTDENGYPGVGNWMLLECSKNAQRLANTWSNYKVSKDVWKDSVMFTPDIGTLTNGKLITAAQGVDVYNVVPRNKPGFFKAYQSIDPGAEFTFTIYAPKDIAESEEMALKCVEAVLDKMQIIGLGAYRLRFGKFRYV